MGRLVFISQGQMEKLLTEGAAEIKENNIILRLDNTLVGDLEEAYYFVRNVVSGSDSRELIGKVFTREEVLKLGGDIMQNSVIIGDDAYDVEEGFLVFEQGVNLSGGESPKRSRTQEIKSLASFILENLKSGK